MENKTFDVDLMAIIGHFSTDQANDILVETEYPGFYFINDLNDQLWKVVDIHFLEETVQKVLNRGGNRYRCLEFQYF